MDRADLYANARNLMVDGQVRPNRVYDRRLLEAMRTLPRERFLPAGLGAHAYTDEDVPLGHGRFLIEPMVIARLVQLGEIRDRDSALVVAAGTGYGAALVAACGARVVALEEDEALLAIARGMLAEWAPGIDVVQGPLPQGWRSGAPYDVILIDGAVEDIPEDIIGQLRPAATHGGGRLVTVRRSGGVEEGVVGEVIAGALRLTPAFGCATPVLPAFRREPGFVF